MYEKSNGLDQIDPMSDGSRSPTDDKHGHSTAVALATVVQTSKPSPFSKSMLRLYAVLMIGYLVSTMNGYDMSLMSGVNAMPAYQRTFSLSGAGSSTGIIFIIYNLGQITAFPFCGFLADTFGRRICIFVGCLVVLVGTAVQTTANTKGHFIAGRFVLGFGASIASAAGPAYVVELAHPAYRGVMGGFTNTLWWFGNIIAGWATYGADKHLQESSWAWRVPTVVQGGIPAFVMCVVLFCPESPRWLIMQGRVEEAQSVLARYHGEGNREADIVTLQVREIVDDVSKSRDENPFWDFRELFMTRAARYRLLMVIATAFIGQWSGNNVISYFMPNMIKAAGIDDAGRQLLINAINPIFCMFAAMYGATCLDRLGRRKMMMGSLGVCMICYCLLTIFTAQTQTTGNGNLAYGTIVFIYLFGICFSWGWTPLQTLYPVECLENRTRAKGSGLNFLFLNIAIMVNTYGISVGMEKIGWKLYIIYIVWICIEIAFVFFFFVETAGRSLEQLSEIFEAKNPRKASTKKILTRDVEITSSS